MDVLESPIYRYIYPYRTPSKRSLNIFLSRTQLDQYWNSVYSGTARNWHSRGLTHSTETGIVPSSAKYTCTVIQTGGQGGEMGNRTWPMISAGSVPEFCVFLSN